MWPSKVEQSPPFGRRPVSDQPLCTRCKLASRLTAAARFLGGALLRLGAASAAAAPAPAWPAAFLPLPRPLLAGGPPAAAAAAGAAAGARKLPPKKGPLLEPAAVASGEAEAGAIRAGKLPGLAAAPGPGRSSRLPAWPPPKKGPPRKQTGEGLLLLSSGATPWAWLKDSSSAGHHVMPPHTQTTHTRSVCESSCQLKGSSAVDKSCSGKPPPFIPC